MFSDPVTEALSCFTKRRFIVFAAGNVVHSAARPVCERLSVTCYVISLSPDVLASFAIFLRKNAYRIGLVTRRQ